MKTINYYLIICLCLCLVACNSNDKPEVEEPEIEDPVEVEEPEIEDPVEVEEPEIEEPEIEEPIIEEPCPDLDEVNPHFVYGEIPARLERLAYMGMPRPAGSYNYPIYPGMDEWKNLKTAAEMGDVQQVTPACLLSKMSTQAVIQAIWEKPLCGEFFIFLEVGYLPSIESDIRLYNAYEELTKREDAGTALLERLTLVDPVTGFPYYESQVLELLLSRTDILSQLNEKEKRKTVKITLSNAEKRADHQLMVHITAWILMGKTMYIADYGPFLEAMNENKELKYFVENRMPNPFNPPSTVAYHYSDLGNIPELIIEYAKNFIND